MITALCDTSSAPGLPLAPEKIVEAIEVFGPVMAQGFGQTEACFPMTFISPRRPPKLPLTSRSGTGFFPAAVRQSR